MTPLDQVQMLPAELADFIPVIYIMGMDLIREVQSLANPLLTSIMIFITELGSAKLFFPLILFIFWWIDEKKGLHFGIIILVSFWINYFLKNIFRQPRPFHLDSSLALVYQSGYGIPSGHAQTALCFYIYLAAWLSRFIEKAGIKRIIWAAFILLILLVSFSRIYLGLHFPTDILAGWAIGGIILVIFFYLEPVLTRLFFRAKTPTRLQNISVAFIALIMNELLPAYRAIPALFLGFCIGYTIMKSRFPFLAQGEIKGKKPGLQLMVVRCLTGFLGVGIIFVSSRLMFPGEGSLLRDLYYWSIASPFYELGQFVRYGLIGLWVSAGAPRVFQQMGLAANE